MRASAFKYSLLSFLLATASLIIILLPYHALMTVWAASNFGHYTLFRLWKEFLVFILGLGVIWLFIFDRKVRLHTLRHKLTWLIAAYVVLDLIVAATAYLGHGVSGKAMAYGLLDDLRFLAFFVICWAIAVRTDRFSKRWYKLMIWPAVLVVVFGLLQMSVLPANVLAHFGYGPKTIMPFETINHNSHYIRILSTLRGANPLGAYLIVPISALVVLLARYPKSWNWTKVLLLAGALVVLIGSYSRAAWIGALLACAFIGIASIKGEFIKRYKLQFSVAAGVLVILAAGVAYAFHSSTRFQNIIFHTQTHSSSPVSSDQAHLSALRSGLKAVVRTPLGRGPGTSGPASVYNHDAPARIPEDYFLEIGEETGILGLVLFVSINVTIGYLLWRRRRSPFAFAMLASLIGITFVNLLSLAWTDDTLSYIWWGLAGVALAMPADAKTAHTKR